MADLQSEIKLANGNALQESSSDNGYQLLIPKTDTPDNQTNAIKALYKVMPVLKCGIGNTLQPGQLALVFANCPMKQTNYELSEYTHKDSKTSMKNGWVSIFNFQGTGDLKGFNPYIIVKNTSMEACSETDNIKIYEAETARTVGFEVSEDFLLRLEEPKMKSKLNSIHTLIDIFTNTKDLVDTKLCAIFSAARIGYTNDKQTIAKITKAVAGENRPLSTKTPKEKIQTIQQAAKSPIAHLPSNAHLMKTVPFIPLNEPQTTARNPTQTLAPAVKSLTLSSTPQPQPRQPSQPQPIASHHMFNTQSASAPPATQRGKRLTDW